MVEVEMVKVEIRKFIYDLAVEYAEKYPVFYEHAREFIETGIRNELIKLKTMERKQ